MVKVTIEHDDGTEIVESEVVFVVCMTAKEDNEKVVNIQSSAWGELPKKYPEAFIQAAGNGTRGIIKGIGAAGVEDAEFHFLVGFVGNPPKKAKGSFRDRIRRFFGMKEDKA